MRFWPFGKRQRAATSDAPAAPAPASAPERPPTGAWRQLPALRPTSASLTLTAPVQRLTDTLTSTQRTQVSAGELSHARPLTGPTGSVAGLVRPHRTVQHGGSGSPLTFAHAPEPIEAADAVPIRPWASTQRLPAASSVTAPSVKPSGASAAPSPSALPSSPARPMPVRAIPSPPVVESVPAATTAAAPLALPALQRSPEADTSDTSDTSDSSRSPGGPSPAAPAAAKVERSIVEAPAATRADRPTLGSTRIVRRIGAPMHARPASMVDAVPVESAPVQALPVAAPGSSFEPSPPVPVEPARLVTPQAPGALPARPARSMASAAASAIHGSGGPAPIQRLDASSDAPLVGGGAHSMQRLQNATPTLTIPKMTNPEQSVAARPDVVPARRGVQRAPESVPPTVRSELEPVLGDSLSDVKVHRGPETGAAARSIQAKAFTTGGAVYMPDEHGSTSSGEGRKILSHELTHVVQQRTLGGSLPSEDSTEGVRLEHEARVVGGQAPVPTRPVAATARPAAAAPAQRLVGSSMPSPSRSLTTVPGVPDTQRAAFEGSPMPLSSQAAIAATVQAAATRAGVPSSASTPPSMSSSGSVNASVSPPSTPTPGGVQRLTEAQANADAPSASTASPATQTASSVSAPETSSATDLDDLERQLYPRIRTRLKSDLLADRERSGRLFDR